MRELKFRYWNPFANKLVYSPIVFKEGWTLEQYFSDRGWTWEQYTGLKDKNGKEIYEGDIVRYGRHIGGIIPPESHMETVSWWSGEEEYYPCCTTSGFRLPYSEDGYEVIGNIHENPDLIEKEIE